MPGRGAREAARVSGCEFFFNSLRVYHSPRALLKRILLLLLSRLQRIFVPVRCTHISAGKHPCHRSLPQQNCSNHGEPEPHTPSELHIFFQIPQGAIISLKNRRQIVVTPSLRYSATACTISTLVLPYQCSKVLVRDRCHSPFHSFSTLLGEEFN